MMPIIVYMNIDQVDTFKSDHAYHSFLYRNSEKGHVCVCVCTYFGIIIRFLGGETALLPATGGNGHTIYYIHVANAYWPDAMWA